MRHGISNGLILAFRTRGLDPTLTLKLERIGEKRGTRICLSGELRSAHLDGVRTEIEQAAPPVTLDPEEVDIVDLDGVRFLNAFQAQAVEVVNCTPYIREWISQEKLGQEK